MGRWRDALDRYGWMVIAVVGVHYTGVQVHLRGFDLGRWDYMRLSAWFWLAFGFDLAQQAPRRMREMVERLHRRGALDAGHDEVERVVTDIDRRSTRWGVIVGAASAVLLLAAHLTRGGLNAVDYGLTVVGAFGGGFHLGRGAS